MHRHHALLYSLVILGGLPAAALAGTHPVILPPDSFINQHVASMPQMSQQVTLDPVVRRRLARHFHTSGPAIVRYIQDNLVLKKTTTAGRYKVYCISRTGREYILDSRLPAGTPVFVMRTTGKPILKLACGNPMVALLPPVVTKTSPYTSPTLASLPKPIPAPIAPGLAPNGPVLVAINSGPGVIITPAPITQVGGILQSLPVRGGGFPIGLLAGIPIIAGLASHGGGTNSPGGGTGTGTSTGTTGGTGTTGTGTGTTGTGTGTTGTGTGTTGTGTGTTGTGTGTTGTGTGTTGTGTTGTGTTGTGTGTTGTDTGTTGTDTGTTGTDTGTTGTGTTGTTGTGTMGTDTGGTTPVPEPSTPAAFTVGAAVLGYLLLARGAAAKRHKMKKAKN